MTYTFKVGDRVRVVRYSYEVDGAEGEVVGLSTAGFVSVKMLECLPSHIDRWDVWYFLGEEIVPITPEEEDLYV